MNQGQTLLGTQSRFPTLTQSVEKWGFMFFKPLFLCGINDITKSQEKCLMAFSDSIWLNQIQICLFTFICIHFRGCSPRMVTFDTNTEGERKRGRRKILKSSDIN